MTGFEPWSSDIGSDRSTNWATTTALEPLSDWSLKGECESMWGHEAEKSGLNSTHLVACPKRIR